MRRQLRELGLLALHRLRVRLPDHLDVADGELVAVRPEVEVVDRNRLLEDGLVELLRQRDDRLAVVEHVVPSHLIRAVGKAVRVVLVGRAEEELRGVGRTCCDDDHVRGVDLFLAVAAHHDARHRPTGSIGVESRHLGVDEQRHVRHTEHRPYRDGLRIGLGVHETRVPVAPRAADAVAARAVVLVEQDPARRVERVISTLLEVVGQLLDPRLVRHGRPRILLAPVPLGRVLTVVAVHLVEPFGFRVVRLEVVVGQRPGGRDPVDMPEITEVPGPEPVQRRAVHLRRAPDEVVHLRLERCAVGVVPRIRCDVATVDEHRPGIPIGHLTRKEVPPLQQQDPFPGVGEAVSQGSTAGARPDDDDVKTLRHGPLPSGWPDRRPVAAGPASPGSDETRSVRPAAAPAGRPGVW